MLLPLLVAALQLTTPTAPTAARDARPVRVWLGSTGLFTRGSPVRVYVRAAQDGNLIVLHRRTDGRIEVLFPSNPSDDPYVTAGTYEIQATAGRVAFVVAEPDGSGLVLAALAPAGYRFDEFVREAAWNPDALAPTWNGADGEGVLSDIVQRMLGDGYFNYDITTYTVAPPVYAMQQDSSPSYPTYPTCTDCTFIGFQENVFEPLALCDAFFSSCLGARFHHFSRSNGAPAPAATSTIALAMRGSSGRALIPQNGRSPGPPRPPRNSRPSTGFVRKISTLGSPQIGPRVRVPAAPQPIALGPGRRAVAHAPTPLAVNVRRRVTSAPAGDAAQVVRLTLSPTAVRDEPDRAASTGTIALTGLTVTRAVALAPQREDTPERLIPRARTPLAQPEPPATEAPSRSRAVAIAGGSGGGRGISPRQGGTIALPPAVFHGAQARIAAGVGVRRR
jgi:hypothetical protein